MSPDLVPVDRFENLVRDVAHGPTLGLNEQIFDRVHSPMSIEFSCTREVPLRPRTGLALMDARLDYVKRRGQPNDRDVCVGDRIPVAAEALPLPEHTRKNQTRDALFLAQPRHKQPQSLDRESLAEAIVGRLRMEISQPVNIEEGMRHISLFEKLHRFKGDRGLSYANRASDEEDRKSHPRQPKEPDLRERAGMSPERGPLERWSFGLNC